MFNGTLNSRELQVLIVALRYWRTHRADGVTRRTDPEITASTIDILLAKLASSAASRTLPDRTEAES